MQWLCNHIENSLHNEKLYHLFHHSNVDFSIFAIRLKTLYTMKSFLTFLMYVVLILGCVSWGRVSFNLSQIHIYRIRFTLKHIKCRVNFPSLEFSSPSYPPSTLTRPALYEANPPCTSLHCMMPTHHAPSRSYKSGMRCIRSRKNQS